MWTTCGFLVNVKEGYDIHIFLGQSALDNLSSYKKGLKDHEPKFKDLSILSFTLNKKREKTLLIFFSFLVPTIPIWIKNRKTLLVWSKNRNDKHTKGEFLVLVQR